MNNEEKDKDLKEAVPTGEKVWIIYDSRARFKDTDDCAVYEVFNSYDEVLEDVYRAIKDNWPDGVIFEYDEVKGVDGITYIINQRQLN